MRYVEINARNYWWTEIDDFRQDFYKERANNEFVKKWIDTTLKRYIINEAEARLVSQNYIDNYIDKKEIPEYVKIGVKNQNLYKNALLRFNVEHAIDYLNTLPPRPIKMSVEQVREAVKKWDEQKTKAKGNGKIEKVHSYKGYDWYKLLDPTALDYESDKMGHCVGKGGYDANVEIGETIIYSLRYKNEPHVTIECNKKGELYQIKGKQNKVIVEKYKPIVIEFLNNYLKIKKTPEDCEDFFENMFVLKSGKVVNALSIKNWKDTEITYNMAQKLLDDDTNIDGACLINTEMFRSTNGITLNNKTIKNVTFKSCETLKPNLYGNGNALNCNFPEGIIIHEFEGTISGMVKESLKILKSKVKINLQVTDIKKVVGVELDRATVTGKIKTESISNVEIFNSELCVSGNLIFEEASIHRSKCVCPKLDINAEIIHIDNSELVAKTIKTDHYVLQSNATKIPNHLNTKHLQLFCDKKVVIPHDLIITECVHDINRLYTKQDFSKLKNYETLKYINKTR